MKEIRRVVTGHDESGRSVFIMDGPPPVSVTPGKAGVTVTELWETHSAPADNRGRSEATDHPFRLQPSSNGSVFRIVEYQPDKIRAAGNHNEQFRDMNAATARDTTARHFGFHKTDTTDYAIVLDGEIYALMDDGEVLLKAGDILIQRGTNHAWSNRSEHPVRIAFVLLDAHPVLGRS
jgi:mannose-6-phosphate isomerase-like protein (cupin superfamily)